MPTVLNRTTYITSDLSSPIERRWGYSGRHALRKYPLAGGQLAASATLSRDSLTYGLCVYRDIAAHRARIGYLWIPVRRFIGIERIYATSRRNDPRRSLRARLPSPTIGKKKEIKKTNQDVVVYLEDRTR